jgi:hypothetical protein
VCVCAYVCMCMCVCVCVCVCVCACVCLVRVPTAVLFVELCADATVTVPMVNREVRGEKTVMVVRVRRLSKLYRLLVKIVRIIGCMAIRVIIFLTVIRDL